MSNLILCTAIFSASALAGMLGVGVAFAAVPIIAIAKADLVNEVQPLALFLNGITAAFAAIAFGRAGYVDWPRSGRLAIVASLFAPVGALAALHVSASTLWALYFAAVLAVIYLLVAARPQPQSAVRFELVLLAAAPVSALSGLLGVGPGFLLVPLMIYCGSTPRQAAAMNAVAVTPSSFLSLIPHLGSASIDPVFAGPVVISAAVAGLLGGHLSSRRIPEKSLRQLFILMILAFAGYKAVTVFAPGTADTLFRCDKSSAAPMDVGFRPCD